MTDKQETPHRHAQPKDLNKNKDQQRGQGSQGGQTNQNAYDGARDRGNTQRH